MKVRCTMKRGHMTFMDRTFNGKDMDQIEHSAKIVRRSILKEFKGHYTGARFGPDTKVESHYVETPELYNHIKDVHIDYEIIEQ